MIHPAALDGSSTPAAGPVLQYEIAPCTDLPAFDPTPTVKTALLGPHGVKAFNDIVRRIGRYVVPAHSLGILLAVVMFVVPAPVGRVLAPLSAFLHLPGMIVFAGGLHTEFAKFLLRTFDFWFLAVSNTVWAVALCFVLQDLRVSLVVVIWGDFNNVFFQESYFRDPLNIALIALWEALFLVFLMAAVSLDLVDGGQQYELIKTHKHTLSTKDVLVNVLGTMATLMLRTMYRRLMQFRQQRRSSDTAVQSIGYRCRIKLKAVGPPLKERGSVVPGPGGILARTNTVSLARTASARTNSDRASRSHQLQLLQLHFATDPGPIDHRDTVWPRLGSLKPLSTCQLVAFKACAVIGRLHSSIILFPQNSELPYGAEALAALGFALTVLVCGFQLYCCQRQLLKRVMTSFDYWFISVQGLAAGLCLCDVFYWRWTAICAVVASVLWGNSVLTLDAVTPSMRRRLGIKMWMVVLFIVAFMAEQLVLLLDILVWDNWELQDRILWDIDILGHNVRLHVVPFLLSRQITIFIWCTRILYNVATRESDGSLILLRGHTEFDYESWRRGTKRRRANARSQETGGK